MGENSEISHFIHAIFYSFPKNFLTFKIICDKITVTNLIANDLKGFFKIMKKLSLALALIMTLLCVFTACGEEESGGITIDPSSTNSQTQTVSGLTGESYTLSKSITKIVSLSPSASMIIDGLGATSKLIAVDEVSAEYVSADTTTAADAVSLAPEVILVDAAYADEIGETDIPVYTVPAAESSDDVKKLIRLCGKLTGTSSDALELQFTNSMGAAQMGSSSYTEKLSAYIDLGDSTVGSGTYITEALYAAGLVNICTAEGTVEMTDDEIIAANPAFIFTIGDVNDYLGNEAFTEVDAVKNGYVYALEEKEICYASHLLAEAVTDMYGAVSDTRVD